MIDAFLRSHGIETGSYAELQDEVRELIFEYENHMRLSRLKGCDGVLEFLITGATELAEDVIKLRFSKIAKLATAVVNRRVQLLQAEAVAPGRELALIPELKKGSDSCQRNYV